MIYLVYVPVVAILVLAMRMVWITEGPSHFVIKRKTDDDYLRRWYVIPRNKWFNIYLHNTLMDDDDQALHDHPWWNVSIVLKGGYWEVMPMYRPLYPDLALDVMTTHHRRLRRKPGSVVFRRATDAHRLELGRGRMVDGEFWNATQARQFSHYVIPSWSLFITGPRRRVWGWWTKQGWKPHTDIATMENGVSRHKSDATQ